MDYDNEIWLPIKGFEGSYEVSNLGRVKSVERKIFRDNRYQPIRERILSQKLSKKGYMIVGLRLNAKSKFKYVHRLVGETFLERPDYECEINHIDENKTNNVLSNLEWCTHLANINHGTGRERHAAAIRIPVSCYTLEGELVRHYGSITEAGKDLGVLKTSVWAALSGKSKTCKGMIWKYDR